MGFSNWAALKLACKQSLVKVVCCRLIALFKLSLILICPPKFGLKQGKKLQFCFVVEVQDSPWESKCHHQPENVSLRLQENSRACVQKESIPWVLGNTKDYFIPLLSASIWKVLLAKNCLASPIPRWFLIKCNCSLWGKTQTGIFKAPVLTSTHTWHL